MTNRGTRSGSRTQQTDSNRTGERGRNGRDKRGETYRVVFEIGEARELRALLQDDEGDADEDFLDAVIAALAPGANRNRTVEDSATVITIRLSLPEKDAVRRAVKEVWPSSDIPLLTSVVRKLDNAFAYAPPTT